MKPFFKPVLAYHMVVDIDKQWKPDQTPHSAAPDPVSTVCLHEFQ